MMISLQLLFKEINQLKVDELCAFTVRRSKIMRSQPNFIRWHLIYAQNLFHHAVLEKKTDCEVKWHAF
jgi:hypothetical protein